MTINECYSRIVICYFAAQPGWDYWALDLGIGKTEMEEVLRWPSFESRNAKI